MRDDWLAEAGRRAEGRLAEMDPKQLGPAGRILMASRRDAQVADPVVEAGNVVNLDGFRDRRRQRT